MNKFLVGSSVVLGLGVAVVGVAADPRSEEVKGSAVTITGCVASSDSDSFVLTHVQRISPPAADAALGANGMTSGEPEVIYWLSKDSIDKMRGHVGHKVEVTGTVTDVSRGTVDVKQHPGKSSGPDNKVEVDARGKSASAKTDRPVEPGSAPPVGTKTEEKKNLPVHRIGVDTVRMIATTCP